MFYRRGGVVRSLAFSQIFILLLSIFSFVFLISESSVVDAQWGFFRSGKASSSSFIGPPQASSITKIESSSDGKSSSQNIYTAKFPDGTSAITESRFFVDKGAVDITLDSGVKISNVYGVEKLPGGKANFLDSSGKTISGGENIDYNKAESAIKTAGGSLEEVGGYKGPLGITGGLGYLAQGLSTALLVVGGIQLVGGLLGLDKSLTNSLSLAVG